MIGEERARQVSVEGWTAAHDDGHSEGTIALAGAVYAQNYAARRRGATQPIIPGVPTAWPWCPSWWKPTPLDPVKQLVKAGALIAAEIDRLLRVEGGATESPKGGTPTASAGYFVDGLVWYELSSISLGYEWIDVLAATSVDGIGVMVRWSRRDVDQPFEVLVLDTESGQWGPRDEETDGNIPEDPTAIFGRVMMPPKGGTPTLEDGVGGGQ